MSAAPVSNITWLDDTLVTEVRITSFEDTPASRSVTGYGRKIPSSYMLRIDRRWHRVYFMVYGNSGTAYVLKGGEELILDVSTEHRLEMYRDASYALWRKGVGTPTPQPVRLDTLKPWDRFRFQHDGVVSSLISTSSYSSKYRWQDYGGEHYLYAGNSRLTGAPAWPYVFPTEEPQTDPNYCAEKDEFGTCIHSDHTR